MIDIEKRAHDLAIACIPGVMAEFDWQYHIFGSCQDTGNVPKEDTASINPDIVNTYLELYSSFLDQLNAELS